MGRRKGGAVGARLVLAINPGSTSTKLAVFSCDRRGEARLLDERTLAHGADELKPFAKLVDQEEWRAGLVEDYLSSLKLRPADLSAVVGRGGLLRPLEGGTYRVSPRMLGELRSAKHGEHASNLGAIIAARVAKEAGCPAFIVDPVVVDELADEARLTGLPALSRRSIFHALSQKAAARLAAGKLGKSYARADLVVAHLGGGVSVGAHRRGRVVEVNNALDGDGPFTPERAGTLPAGDWMRLVLSGRHGPAELKKMVTGRGGLVAHLGTNSLLEVLNRARKGERRAKLVFEAMTYNLSRAILAAAAAFGRAPEAIVLTGAMAHSKELVAAVKRRAGWAAPVIVFAGSLEMPALAGGACRVLAGREKARSY